MSNARPRDGAGPAGEPIAIVGIGCRLPGGGDADGYWRLLIDGRSAIVEVPRDRWSVARFYDANPQKPHTAVTRWGGFLPDIAGFDADLFRVSPREALSMDPQQRLMLQVTWEALEDAGIPADRLRGSDTGVYVGVSTSDYAMLRWAHGVDDGHLGPGLALSVVANRISHKLDLRGPSLSVDTACSSSLVALHLACTALWSGETSLAIAGGVNLILTPVVTINFSKAHMMSAGSRLRAFDARADGYIRGEGAGVVVLRRLSDAVAGGDRIHAVVRSSVVGQNGHSPTITAPNGDAQRDLLERACALAGVDPRRVDFIEAHGTGTPVGDPAEATAIGQVFGAPRSKGARALMGPAKPNIGHLEAGAGVAGLIKAALVASRGEVPPNIDFEIPNPAIPFDDLKLRVPTELVTLAPGAERHAVVNSFGFGGTNACAVLSSYRPTRRAPARAAPPRYELPCIIVPLSAATPGALAARARALAAFVDETRTPLADVARQLAVRRAHLDHRAVVIAPDAEEALGLLREMTPEAMPAPVVVGRRRGEPGVAFVFAGQGSQWWAMGRTLALEDPVYRQTLERFDAAFQAVSGWSIVRELLADSEATSRIDDTVVTQPALCALQIALVERWRDWGVAPAAVIGHSIGEIAAAYTAGVLTLEQAAVLSYHRSRVVPERAGAIAVVGVTLDEAEALCATIGEGLVEIAGINSPTLISVAGDRDQVQAIVEHLAGRTPAPFVRLVRMHYAPHSFHADGLKAGFCQAVGTIETRPPRIPWISTVTGELIQGAPDTDYFWGNIRQPVRYQQAVRTARALGWRTFLEIGPHPTLAAPTLESLDGDAVVVASLVREQGDAACLARAIAQLRPRPHVGLGGDLGAPAVPRAPAVSVRGAAVLAGVRGAARRVLRRAGRAAAGPAPEEPPRDVAVHSRRGRPAVPGRSHGGRHAGLSRRRLPGSRVRGRAGAHRPIARADHRGRAFRRGAVHRP